MNIDDKIRQIENQLTALDQERSKLLTDLKKLRSEKDSQKNIIQLGQATLIKPPETNDEKSNLFLSLFRGRENVYPKHWENNKTGRSGYSPACNNEWTTVCHKATKHIKCSECNFQKFYALNESAVASHLSGKAIIGTYAIREDDTCIFLACDFDESSWQADILAFSETAKSLGIQVAIERSISGNGGHAWIFFAEPVPARQALQSNRFPLLVSDRKDHLDLLAALIKESNSSVELILLEGTLTNKQRRIALNKITEFKKTKIPVIILATASLIGEGFDLPELDTLIFTTPLSFEGRLIQYAGRIHRSFQDKTTAKIIDFVDSYSPMFLKMYRSRVSTYKKMGYKIHEDELLMGPLYKQSKPNLQP